MKLLQKHSRIIINFFLLSVGLILIASNITRWSTVITLKPWLSIIIFIIEIYFLSQFFITFKFSFHIIVVSFIFLILLVLQSRYFIISLQSTGENQREINIFFVTFFQFIFLILASIPVLANSLSFKLLSLEEKLNSSGKRIYIFSLFLLGSMVFIHSPLTVFVSSWQELEFSVLSILPWFLLYFVVFFLFTYIIYRLVPRELKVLFVYTIFFVAFTFWFYTYLLPGDFGHLDNFKLSKIDVLYNSVLFYRSIEIIGLIISFILMAFFLYRFPNMIISLLIVLNLMTFGQTTVNILSSGAFFNKQKQTLITSEPPEYASELLSFSRERNVLVIMMDMFSGGFMPEILEANPNLYEDYKGFTWYANILSTTASTYASIPAIVGGSKFTVEQTGVLIDETLKDRYAAAFSFFPNFFKSYNYSIAFADSSYHEIDLAGLEDEQDVLLGRSVDFVPYWETLPDSEYGGDTRIPASEYSRIFSVIALFKGSPFLLKSKIYYNGSWLKTNHSNVKIRHAVREIALLDVASELSNADSPHKTFKYISSSLTHIPWPFDGDGNISKAFISSNPQLIKEPESGKMFDNPLLPYNATVKTLNLLAKWFKWMKDEGIYDNTRIIIVSDHGNSGIDPMFKDLRVIQNDNGQILDGTGRAHPILMVKDFNSAGSLVRSNHFTTNADTAAFATMGIADVDPIPNPLEIDSDTRKLTFSFVASKPDTSNEKSYRISNQFEVLGSIFEKKNWTDTLNTKK